MRAGPKLWTACEHKRLSGFAATAAALADDAGLINEADLMELAGSHQWDGEIEDLVAGCRLVRVFDHVAAQDSVTAAAKSRAVEPRRLLSKWCGSWRGDTHGVGAAGWLVGPVGLGRAARRGRFRG